MLVGLLADDKTLQPRDIVVMCPDIETFAPLISASFGLDTEETAAEHPVTGCAYGWPTARCASSTRCWPRRQLVALADARMEASALLDLCARRRSPASSVSAGRPRTAAGTGGAVGRALGPGHEHRDRFGMGGFAQNTWAAGLGPAAAGGRDGRDRPAFIGTALPLDDVDSTRCRPGRRLAECSSRVRS